MNDKAASGARLSVEGEAGFSMPSKEIEAIAENSAKNPKKLLINQYVTDKIQMCGEKWSELSHWWSKVV